MARITEVLGSVRRAVAAGRPVRSNRRQRAHAADDVSRAVRRRAEALPAYAQAARGRGRALAVADPARETVSGIARRFGLSDTGRMAKDYSELFGEYPRVTLMRKPRGAGKACYAKPVG